ncbi:MAG: glycosyltransferase family 2 protein [Comamonadaceae bacterium]|nr:MAG: glycosyltransferase family 2 protein [Comamonadaceae bacterium]
MSNEICVAMCVYNAAATLRQALDSLKAQTFADFDLVVVDDGSTDGSAEILESYRPIFPSMTVVRQKNGGIGVARNAAVALSGHKWLAFIDSDDVWHPAKLACQLRVAQGDAAPDGVVCKHVEFVEDAELRTRLEQMPKPDDRVEWLDDLAARLLTRNFDFHPASVLWRRSALVEAGGYTTDRNGEDFQPFLVLALAGRRIGRVPDVLYMARINPGSLSRSTTNHYVGAMARIAAIDRILQGAVRVDGWTLDAAAREQLQTARQRFLRWALHGVRAGYPRGSARAMSWPLIGQLNSHRVRAIEFLKTISHR